MEKYLVKFVICDTIYCFEPFENLCRLDPDGFNYTFKTPNFEVLEFGVLKIYSNIYLQKILGKS